MVKRAATQAGYRHGTLWLRDRIARMLAYELGEDYDAIMAGMPKSWEDNPGAARIEHVSDQAAKSGVQEGQAG